MPEIDTGITEGDLLSELTRQIAAETNELRSTDVTVPQLVQATGKKRNWIERFLAQQVQDGKLIVVSAIDPATGRRVNAYRKPG